MALMGDCLERVPRASSANTIDVQDLDAMLVKIMTHGGTIINPKMAIPGIGWFALFKDAEDNVFGLMQEDNEAGI